MKARINMTEEAFRRELIDAYDTVVVEFISNLSIISDVAGNRMINILKSLREEIKFVQIDYYHNEEISRKYKIYDIPIYLIFRNGDLVKKIPGFASESEIRRNLKSLNIN
jgi:thioredoxin-like negative regulator of GroEL